jgi:1-acyl-sn-glycerol-3-phosphate acyltransferase
MKQNRLLVHGTSAVLRGLYRLFGGFHVHGLENVPETGAAILTPNHHSWADPPAIRAVIRRDCWFMANDFLFDIRILGKLLPLYGAFPVGRDHIDREALHRAEKHLRDGDLVCIFPEGGTTITGKLYPFEGGAALLAIRNGVPLIPVGITGTDRMLPMSAPYPHRVKGGVTVTFGRPVHPDEADPSQRRKEQVNRLTQRLYRAVADLLPPEYVPQPGEELPGSVRAAESVPGIEAGRTPPD